MKWTQRIGLLPHNERTRQSSCTNSLQIHRSYTKEVDFMPFTRDFLMLLNVRSEVEKLSAIQAVQKIIVMLEAYGSGQKVRWDYCRHLRTLALSASSNASRHCWLFFLRKRTKTKAIPSETLITTPCWVHHDDSIISTMPLRSIASSWLKREVKSRAVQRPHRRVQVIKARLCILWLHSDLH